MKEGGRIGGEMRTAARPHPREEKSQDSADFISEMVGLVPDLVKSPTTKEEMDECVNSHTLQLHASEIMKSYSIGGMWSRWDPRPFMTGERMAGGCGKLSSGRSGRLAFVVAD